MGNLVPDRAQRLLEVLLARGVPALDLELLDESSVIPAFPDDIPSVICWMMLFVTSCSIWESC